MWMTPPAPVLGDHWVATALSMSRNVPGIHDLKWSGGVSRPIQYHHTTDMVSVVFDSTMTDAAPWLSYRPHLFASPVSVLPGTTACLRIDRIPQYEHSRVCLPVCLFVCLSVCFFIWNTFYSGYRMSPVVECFSYDDLYPP